MNVTFGSFTISNEPRRFGLVEAEAAMQYAKDPGQVAAIRAVVVGVLGYKNAVAADIQAANAELDTTVGESEATISAHNDRIAALRLEIERLEGTVTGSNGRKTELATIADLFTGSPN